MTRGLFEKIPGSAVWWIRYADVTGKIRREQAGTKSAARALYQKRKAEVLQGRKLPETLRRREIPLSELLADAADYASRNHRNARLGADGRDYRYATLNTALGCRGAESLTPQEIEKALSKLADERDWKPASFNRHKAFLSLAYRLGVENQKVPSNPVRLIHRRREDNGRVRWLTTDEETRLIAVIKAKYPHELPALLLAIHTGMRRSEQYELAWDCVNLERRLLTIPRSKHGDARYIPLNDTAMEALSALRARGDSTGRVMILAANGHGYRKGHALKTPREWFNESCRAAEVDYFTWHDLRHTFGSRLAIAGVPLRRIQELMGHKTIQITCRYAHLAPEGQLDAVRQLDNWRQDATDTKTDTSDFVPSYNGQPNSTQTTEFKKVS